MFKNRKAKIFYKIFFRNGFLAKFIWKRNNDESITVAGISIDEGAVDYGGGQGRLTKASSKFLFTATNILDDKSGVPQCKIILKQRLDLGGLIPASTINQRMPKALRVVKSIANTF